MQYSFSNTFIMIEGLIPFLLDEFTPFRKMIPESQELFRVTVKKVDTLPQAYGDRVYSAYTGINVFLQNGIEYRLFQNIFTKVPYALLMDSVVGSACPNKTLYVRKTYNDFMSMNERTLFNCIAPEKTLSENHHYILHASFIKTENGALLFTAPSGTGKSTQADLWNKYKGAELINGDRASIWYENGQWYAGGIPWCGTSGIMKNEILPLNAIVILDQALENRVCEIPLLIKVKRLMEQITINPWNYEMLRWTQTDVLKLCEDIPILHLSCRPDKAAVDVLSAALENYYG